MNTLAIASLAASFLLLSQPTDAKGTKTRPIGSSHTCYDANHKPTKCPGMSKKKAIIIGAIVGAIAFIALIIFVWYAVKKRRRAKSLRAVVSETPGHDDVLLEHKGNSHYGRLPSSEEPRPPVYNPHYVA